MNTIIAQDYKSSVICRLALMHITGESCNKTESTLLNLNIGWSKFVINHPCITGAQRCVCLPARNMASI